MTAQDRLRQSIDRQRDRLRTDVPPGRAAAVLAVLRARDRPEVAPTDEAAPDLVFGRRLADPGGNLALRLCLDADGDAAPAAPDPADEGLDGWARRFLAACGEVAAAEAVLVHAETGFMRIAADGDGSFAAWIATKLAPTTWRERADIDWWAAWLAARYEPDRRALAAERPDPAAAEPRPDTFSRLAGVHLDAMAYQLGYPADAEIDGCTVGVYRAVLGALIARALRARDRGDAEPWPESALVAAIAADLMRDPAGVERAVAGFTLDRENAAWHAAAPDVAAAPLVRVGPDRLAWSLSGLTTEPLFFLTRELRRRNAAAYHNAAIRREDVFRQDVYGLFPEKRFVTSAGRVALRRAGGDLRTDVDAVVFDRKTGTLGVFELKSQDPFARSGAELRRQRDNVLYAGRQVSGVLDWLKRHGPDDLLGRVDARAARSFRVQKIVPFVLGRYLVRFDDGPEPDRRATWGTWPQVLRVLDGRPFAATEANPLATLSARLGRDVPLASPPADAPPREIDLGGERLIVYPSFAAFRAGEHGGRGG